MDSEQRRKRKRSYRVYSKGQYWSVRSITLCFSFVAFLLILLLLNRFPISIHAVTFKPVLRMPGLTLLSVNSIQDSLSSSRLLPLKVDDRIRFPDHFLLMISNRIHKAEKLNCVYYTSDAANIEDKVRKGYVIQPVISVEDYDEYRSIARCPIPPVNYSAAVELRRRDDVRDNYELVRVNQTVVVNSWERVVYAAELDGDTAVLFAKGLNLKPHKESDPSYFRCRFGLGNWEKDEGFFFTTNAVSAAQEVVRCKLPRTIRNNRDKAHGIRVTISHADDNERGLVHRLPSSSSPYSRTLDQQRRRRRRYKQHITLPSVARIYNSKLDYNTGNHEKHELCVCTMLWNQAPALREWIMYHTRLGIERWFIYDNNSDDEIQQVIEELELSNYNVSRHTWPWIKTQEAGFSHCALRARDECKWVGFFDVDEYFYFPQDHLRGLPGKNSLRSLVANFSAEASSNRIAEIRTPCHSFGPSGLSLTPPQGVTVGYTCRLQSPERHKSIVRPDLLNDTLLNEVHHFQLREGFTYHNVPESSSVINHYKYQVWETFRAKFHRRVATYVVDWQENQNQGSKDRAPGLGTEPIEPSDWRLRFCEVWDTGLRDFVLSNFADPATGYLPWERGTIE